MQKEILKRIVEIKKQTGLKINSYKVINAGSNSIIIEVNNKWVFRFPRSGTVAPIIKNRWNFLTKFSQVSPIPVPAPKFITDKFIGYKKIIGKPLNLTTLTKAQKNIVAKQLGLFLKNLHNYKDSKIKFDTGYLIMRPGDYKSSPKGLAKLLTSSETKALNNKFKLIAENKKNFIKPKTIIHGDLNYKNILWDKQKQKITGIIDWSDMGLGNPSMDFIELSDFNKPSNDAFLKEILKWYNKKDDSLFIQVKQNSIIDTMNWYWFYLKTNKPAGMRKAIKNLKQVLK